jgi:hypothetical protein
MVEDGYISPKQFVEELLDFIESKGMKPPSVSEEDQQAIMSVYYGGYTFNQWDEDLEKDEKVQKMKTRRAKFKNMTFEERLRELKSKNEEDKS